MDILKNKFTLFFIILPFFKPPYFNSIHFLDILFDTWKVISTILIIFIYFTCNKISKIILYICMFQIILFISTLLNKGHYIDFFSRACSIIGLCMITEINIIINKKRFLKFLFITMSSMIFINFLTLFIFPDGLYFSVDINTDTPRYFLGMDNRFIFIYLPGTTIAFLYSLYNYNKLKFKEFLIFLIAIFTLISTWSVGAMLGMSIFIIYFILIYKNKFSSILNFYTYSLIITSIFFTIVVFRVQNYFKYFIVDILGKDLTLSGRTYIWDRTKDYILLKPIFGNGIEHYKLIQSHIFQVHAHCQFLNILYQGGILGLISFLIILISFGKKLYIYRKFEISKLLSISYFIWMFILIIDSYDVVDGYMYMTFVISYHVDKFLDNIH